MWESKTCTSLAPFIAGYRMVEYIDLNGGIIEQLQPQYAYPVAVVTSFEASTMQCNWWEA